MSDFIKNANWRYATKRYDTTKKVSPEDLSILKSAIRLSASSYGLQPYKVIIIENPKIKTLLQPASMGQQQIVDASHVIVFATIANFGDNHIDEYINNLAQTRNTPLKTLQGFSDYIKIKISELTDDQKNIWAAKQSYIAMANLLNAAAELKIDATPMEGFVPKEYNEILFLNELKLNATVVVTIGYRHAQDANQHFAKVRKSNEELFINLY